MTPNAQNPLLVLADDDPAGRAAIEQELDRRYGADYDVRCGTTATLAATLDAAEAAGTEVAVVLASGEAGAEALARVRGRFPTARRGLLVPWLGWTDRTLAELVLRSMARGWIDLYVLRPAGRRDEVFHRTVGELLQESARLRGDGPAGATVLAEPRSPRAHELRSVLAGLGIPHRVLDRPGPPAVSLADGTVLEDPTAAELARALGFPTELEEHEADLVVVGAGPAGLAAAVYGASEGLRTMLVEGDAAGGQAGSSSLIENYLGFPSGLSGSDLARRALTQARRFGAEFLLAREIRALETREGSTTLHLSDGSSLSALSVLVATGVKYRRLDTPGCEELTGRGVYYGAAGSEAESLSGEDVFIVGGANSAGQAAVHFAKSARKVTMLVRGASLSSSMSNYLVKRIAETGNIEVCLETQVVRAIGEEQLEALELSNSRAGSRSVPATTLFVFVGASPRTEWLDASVLRDEHGFVLTGPDLLSEKSYGSTWKLERPPLLLETSAPGVFAAGDVRHGSAKRVAAAVGEGSMAVMLIWQYRASLGL